MLQQGNVSWWVKRRAYPTPHRHTKLISVVSHLPPWTFTWMVKKKHLQRMTCPHAQRCWLPQQVYVDPIRTVLAQYPLSSFSLAGMMGFGLIPHVPRGEKYTKETNKTKSFWNISKTESRKTTRSSTLISGSGAILEGTTIPARNIQITNGKHLTQSQKW